MKKGACAPLILKTLNRQIKFFALGPQEENYRIINFFLARFSQRLVRILVSNDYFQIFEITSNHVLAAESIPDFI